MATPIAAPNTGASTLQSLDTGTGPPAWLARLPIIEFPDVAIFVKSLLKFVELALIADPTRLLADRNHGRRLAIGARAAI